MAVFVTGCSMPKLKVPRVHRITIQQGNVITQEMVDRLKPGMTRSQVAYIMGEPVFRNMFDTDRWDYVYTIRVPGVYEQEMRMSLFFEEDSLAYFTGDLVPTDAQSPDAPSETQENAATEPVREGSEEA